MKTKIAILRGPSLNDAELASYVPLMTDYAFSFYSSSVGSLPIRTPGVTPQPLRYADDFVRTLPARLQPWVLQISQKYLGCLEFPFSLAEVCRTHAILHTAETFKGYSRRAVELKARYGHKVVVTVWENNPFQYENIPTRRLGKKLGLGKSIVREQADHFLVPAQASRLALELEGVPTERITYIGTAIDLERYRPRPRTGQLRSRLGLSADAKIILFAGRQVWEKGVFDLLEAFALLCRTQEPGQDVHLLYFGSGIEGARLRRESEQLGLSGRVHFQSGQAYTNSDQMPALYNEVDLLVLPSLPIRFWQEQFGVVLIEAMASGVPVVGSSSGAIPEVIGDAGLIFPTHDIRALTACIARILGEPALQVQCAARGRERVEQHYAPAMVADRIRGAYEHLLRTR